MKKLNSLANEMIYGDIVQKIAKDKNVGLSEARNIVSRLSFRDYQIIEATVPAPSGQTIGPTGSSAQPSDSAGTATAGAPSYVKGTPPKEGQSVSVKGRTGQPIGGTIKRVDQMKNGALVFNPETNKEEWMNFSTLEPFMVSAGPAKPPAPGQPGNQTDAQGALAQSGRVAEDAELSRLLKLAGLQENCSGGATGAGSIAIAPTSMGMKKRQPTEEGSLKKEYTPKEPAKTIIGDTKPNQASGKLSADLAATGKKAAGRTFNGNRGKRVR